MPVQGVYLVDEEGLDQLDLLMLTRAPKMLKNEDDYRLDETEADENPDRGSVEEEIHEIVAHKVKLDSEDAEDLEPRTFKKLKIMEKTEALIEGGVNVQQDNQIKIKVGVPKLNIKPTNIRAPPKMTYTDIMSDKPKTKSRKCKKPLKKLDKESQQDQALKYLYDWKEYVDKKINGLEEGQKVICEELVDYAKLANEAQEKQASETNGVKERLKTMQEDLAKLKQRIIPITDRVNKPPAENQGKTLPELEKF